MPRCLSQTPALEIPFLIAAAPFENTDVTLFQIFVTPSRKPSQCFQRAVKPRPIPPTAATAMPAGPARPASAVPADARRPPAELATPARAVPAPAARLETVEPTDPNRPANAEPTDRRCYPAMSQFRRAIRSGAAQTSKFGDHTGRQTAEAR